MGEQPPQPRARPQRPGAKPIEQSASDHAPWKPVILHDRQIQAIRACWAGEAGPEEQRRAMKAILEDICGYGGEAFRPGQNGARETDYALGMMKVGREIWKCVIVDFELLKRRNAG